MYARVAKLLPRHMMYSLKCQTTIELFQIFHEKTLVDIAPKSRATASRHAKVNMARALGNMQKRSWLSYEEEK